MMMMMMMMTCPWSHDVTLVEYRDVCKLETWPNIAAENFPERYSRSINSLIVTAL